VAAGDRLYVTIGFCAPLSVLDASTGETIATLEGTEGTDEIVHHHGVLLLCIREIPATGTARGLGQAPSESVLAMRADTGKLLWKQTEEKILPLSLAAAADRVYFHTYDELVCVDLKRGAELWRVENPVAEGAKTDKRSRRLEPWMARNTLVAQDKVVLFLGPRELQAFSAATGERLWTAANRPGCGAAQPPDLFVASGLVWSGGPEGNFNTRDPRNALINGLEETQITKEGRDPLSGEVKKAVTVRNLIDFGHHFRCYRSKATNRYLLWPKRGVEFLDLEGTSFDRCDWLRAPCRLGAMPSGGLLYVPPHQCFCYPGVLLNGFNALAPKRVEGRAAAPRPLDKGPAYDALVNHHSSFITHHSTDWPTYRHDAKRSGSTPATVAADVHVAWRAEVGQRLTAPVVAEGRVLVSDIDSHTVHCLDAAKGEALWSYTAGGRVDSPPTISQGRVLFGSADGWVYCLRAADGQLVWRFRAAPSDTRVIMYDQLTSAWPVHGTVLVEDGVAYFAAGYSSFLDGGIYLYGLDVQTGQTLHEARLDGPHPKIPEEPGWAWDMEGARSEVLVSQGGYIYLRQLKFDRRLQLQQTSRTTRLGDRDVGLHLFSTSSLLDDSWYNRTFWMYSATWPGYYRANRGASKTGQLLVFDATTTYGVRVYEHERVPVPWFVPGAGYQLFADDNDNEPVLAEKAANWDKGPGFTRTKPARWTIKVPVRARALVLAGDNLFLAGPPDVVDADDPLAAFEGRKGGKLWAVSAEDGNKLAEYELDAPPVLDGLIAARGSLYLSTKQGSLVCFQAGDAGEDEGTSR
jgi:outer membrane protein assembly factor BamB